MERKKISAGTGIDADEAWEQALADKEEAEKEWRVLGGEETEDEDSYESLTSGATDAESAWLTALANEAEAEREFVDRVKAEEREKEALAAERQRLEEQQAAEQADREALEREIAEQERKKRAAEQEVKKQCSDLEALTAGGMGTVTDRYVSNKLSNLGAFGGLMGDASAEVVVEMSGCENAREMMRGIESIIAAAESDLDALADSSSAWAGSSDGLSAEGVRQVASNEIRLSGGSGNTIGGNSGGSVGSIPPGSPAASQEYSYLKQRIEKYNSFLSQSSDASLSTSYCSIAIGAKMIIEYGEAGCLVQGGTDAEVRQVLTQYRTQYENAIAGYNEIVTQEAQGMCAIKMKEYGYNL